MASTNTPQIRVSNPRWLRRATPTAVADRPSRMNTTEKPATNIPVSRAMRARWRREPPSTSAMSRPVMTDRYAGTRGSTQGEMKETTPPPKEAR